MIDIHCHILPEVDDGAKTWDIAVEMCRTATRDGIEHIVASPHANATYAYEREAHEARLGRLRELVGNGLEFSLGCDFHLSYENIQDVLQHPERYCIGKTPYLLVEFSDFSLPVRTEDLLRDLTTVGIVPIITHPERNPLLQRQVQRLVEWLSIGVVIQVTANSLTGRWGSTAKKTVETLVKKDAVHVLATDAHDLKSRPPVLSEAKSVMAKMVGEDAARRMVDDNPRAIVRGEPLPG